MIIGLRLAGACAAATLLVASAGCGDDGDATTRTPAVSPQASGSPAAPPVAEAIARASAGLPNVIWDGSSEPRVVPYTGLPDGYSVQPWAKEIDQPASMAFAPDGRLFVVEQHAGNVRIVGADGTLLPAPFATLPNVSQDFELGLVGVAVHPDFPGTPWVYTFHVEQDGDGNPTRAAVTRFTAQGDAGADPEEILELPPTNSDKHNGGGLRFGPDGKLYVTVGDLDKSDLARDLTSPAGKILRLNDDGSVPGDNPFTDNPAADSRIYAWGFRNTFDLAWLEDEEAWIAADNATEEFDEINIIEPGESYGHPDQRGYYVFTPGVEPRMPIATYLLAAGPAGIEVYTRDELSEFTGDVFLCQYHRGGLLHRLRVEDRRVVSDEIVLAGCRSDVVMGPDGWLYFADVTRGTIERVIDAGD